MRRESRPCPIRKQARVTSNRGWYKSCERASVGEVVKRLADLTREPHTAVLLSLAGHFDHWTVLKRVGRHALKLFDSDGHARVRIAECRMSYERHLKRTPEHVIHPPAVFQIAVD